MVSGFGGAFDGPDECWFVGRGPVAADRYDLQSQLRRNTQDQQTKNVVEYDIWCDRGNFGVCAMDLCVWTDLFSENPVFLGGKYSIL